MFTHLYILHSLLKALIGVALLATAAIACADIAPTPPDGMYIFAHEPAPLLSIDNDDYAVAWDRRLRRGCTPGFSCRGIRIVHARVSEVAAARFVLSILTPR
jgi:hypothetical protein